jgi:hypothetical protein
MEATSVNVYGLIYLVILISGCLLVFANWRVAVFVGLAIDILRDPVRKLIPDKPIALTLSGAAFWLLLVLWVAVHCRRQQRRMMTEFPGFKTALTLLIMAMIPAAAVSVLLQPNGILLAAIGGATYLIPLFGVLAGYAFPRNKQAILKFLGLYVLLNSVTLISVVLQYLNVDVPALGGIDFKWIRYREGYIVDLMCGWYRSPDIMGLHAAHVIMFGLLLAAEEKSKFRIGWLSLALWAAFCVLVSGRRKMIGVPFVFVTAFFGLAWIYGIHKVGRFASILFLAVVGGGGASIFVLASDEATEYTEYASSLFTEGAGRSQELMLGSTISTLQTLGILGGGLGSATQGRYYVSQGGGATKGWQEDGVSRLFAEFGLIGVVLVLIAIFVTLRTTQSALRQTARKRQLSILQLGLLSAVIGNVASFCISHQQYSGDPVNGLIVTLLFGMSLQVPVFFETGVVRPVDVSPGHRMLISPRRGVV